MAKNSKWQDEYWLLLLQLYLQKPVGIKPMYSRGMVNLSLELHIAPSALFNKMCQIAHLETPRVERFWELYGNNPKKLKRVVNLLREMWGFNNAMEFYDGVETNESFEKDFKPVVNLLREMWGFNNAMEFYDGVETNESFEKDFKPVADGVTLTPVALTLILDLYFRLTPITMVPETPEVQELAKLIKQKPETVVEVLETFMHCDPYLNRKDVVMGDLMLACQQVWRRFGNANPEDLASYAEQLKEYYK